MSTRPAVAMPCARMFGAALMLCVAAIADAGVDCLPTGSTYSIDEAKRGLGPGHHPVGRPLPYTAAFNQPGHCADDTWFFDNNNNGQADAGEARLFGPQRVVDCGSCHGESADAKSPQSAGVFLRQDAAALCLVCHRL